MKKLLLLLILFFPFFSYPQTTMENIAKSRVVDDEIKLILAQTFNEWSFDYIIDNKGNNKSLIENNYFQVKSSEFRINAEFLNPLNYRLTTTSEAMDDELNKAAEEFMTTAVAYLGGLQKSSPGINTTYQKASLKVQIPSGSTSGPKMEEVTMEPQLLEIYLTVFSKNDKFFSKNKELQKLMAELDFTETQEAIQKNFSEIFTNLKSITKLTEVNSTILENQRVIDGQKSEIENLNKRLEELEEKIQDTDFEKTFKGTGSIVKQFFLGKVKELEQEKIAFLSTRDDLIEKYQALANLFKAIKTTNEDNSFQLFKITEIEKSKRYEITLNLEKLEFDEKTKILTVKEKKTSKIHLRRFQTLIPVVSSGIIYSNVSFNNYGTGTDAEGNTIVEQTSDEDNEISVGAYLNLYFNPVYDIPVFAQFGIGPSKEKPLFFLGGGLEILNRVSISSGAVFTWYPQLNNLTVGDPVEGTAAIEEDISFKFDTNPKFYLGINFDITQ